MNKFRFTIKLFVIATFLLAFASMAQAQASRTWVSGVGDDVNPCSRTAPCKTYAGAISKTALNGEISTLDPGGFGAVNITKGLTIDGTNGSGFGSILAANVNGVIVNEPGTNPVILRNLSINGASFGTGNGIRYIAGKGLVVENCVISGFTGAAGLSTNGRGIDVSLGATARTVTVRNTSIQNCTVGIRITTSTGFVAATLDNVHIEQPTATSGSGIELQNGASTAIRDSVIANYTTGINVSGTAATSTNASLIGTTVYSCGVGLFVGNTTSRITASTFTQNSTAISLSGGTINTGCDNFLNGNTTNVAGGVLTNACVQ